VVTQQAPRFTFLVRVVVVQVMPRHLAAIQCMVLAAVNAFYAAVQQ
jgi:hypothetical protein